jgi:hypothetical protein
MDYKISIIRIIILVAVFGFAIVFLLSEEHGDDIQTLIQALVCKALAFAAFLYGQKLYRHWRQIDPWLMAYEKMCDDVKNAPQDKL